MCGQRPSLFSQTQDPCVPMQKPCATRGCAVILNGTFWATPQLGPPVDAPTALSFLGGDGETVTRTPEPRVGTRRNLALECFQGKLSVNQGFPVRVAYIGVRKCKRLGVQPSLANVRTCSALQPQSHHLSAIRAGMYSPLGGSWKAFLPRWHRRAIFAPEGAVCPEDPLSGTAPRPPALFSCSQCLELQRVRTSGRCVHLCGCIFRVASLPVLFCCRRGAPALDAALSRVHFPANSLVAFSTCLVLPLQP